MPKAILTASQIEDFSDTGFDDSMKKIQQANAEGIWMVATVQTGYKQDFNIESEKGLGGTVHATPGGGSVRVVEGEAEARATIGVDKDREGYAWVSRKMELRSEKAALPPTP